MVQIKDSSYQIKKSFSHAVIIVFVAAVASSWGFTWKVATDKSEIINSIQTHTDNSYIHDPANDHLSEKDLDIYFLPLIQRLDRIEKDINDIKEDR
jgi:hypothetical protein